MTIRTIELKASIDKAYKMLLPNNMYILDSYFSGKLFFDKLRTDDWAIRRINKKLLISILNV